MTNSLIIDFKLLETLELDVNDFLILCNIYYDKKVFNIIINEESKERLQGLRMIKFVDDKVVIRQGAAELIELLTVEVSSTMESKVIIKSSDRVINQDIDARVKEFRDLWRGLKVGSMGSPKSCKDKMLRWMKENPEYSFDQIINAAKLYLTTEGMNTRFLQRADYFIFKQENNREESSRLSAYIDEIGDDDTIGEDWTTQIR